MATRTQVIDQVRRRVHDYCTPWILDTPYYDDAVDFALSKLCFDFGVSYATVDAVSTTHQFLLIKLVTIEACHARAAHDAAEDRAGTGSVSITSLGVPDLTVGEGAIEPSGQTFWMSMANALQEEYDGELQHGAPAVATMELGYINTVSRTTGGLASRKLDKGPSAPSASVSISGTSATITWDVWYDYTFARYEIWRGRTLAMLDEHRLACISDNHENTYVDANLVPGTYYYRVRRINMNELAGVGSVLTAVVP